MRRLAVLMLAVVISDARRLHGPRSQAATRPCACRTARRRSASSRATDGRGKPPDTVDAVWNIMGSVFDSLGIAVGTLDPDQRVIGNTELKVHGRLGPVSLSRYIDCGQTQGFPSAETYDVHMSVLTQVTPGKSNTATVATIVEAVARPAQFKGDYTRCETRGEIEARIPKIATARLQK